MPVEKCFKWGKTLKSPDGKYKASVFCKHDIYEFKVNIVKNESNEIILEQEVISAKPNELIYQRFLGDLEWINNNTIVLKESYS